MSYLRYRPHCVILEMLKSISTIAVCQAILKFLRTCRQKLFSPHCCISDALTIVTTMLDITSVSNFSIYEISKYERVNKSFFLFK